MFVIKYECGEQSSYLQGWFGRLPAFGATIDEAARFDTRHEANGNINAMPITASLMCKVEELSPRDELVALMMIPGGDRAAMEALVDDIAAGKLTLPSCFNIKGATKKQTKRAHELARMLTAN